MTTTNVQSLINQESLIKELRYANRQLTRMVDIWLRLAETLAEASTTTKSSGIISGHTWPGDDDLDKCS